MSYCRHEGAVMRESFLCSFVFLLVGSAGLPAQGLADNTRRQRIHEAFLANHRDASGTVRPDLWRSGVMETRQRAIAADAFRSNGRDVLGGAWVGIGPAPLRIDAVQVFQGTGPDSGEVVDIAIDPRGANDQVVYIATNDGGVWKTLDGGSTWTPLTDSMPSLSMGALALDARNPDIVYAATGNGFDGGCLFTKGVGIYKSLNGGQTWVVLNPGGIFTTPQPPPCRNVGVNRVIHPVNPPGFNIDLLLAGTGNGLFRSIDGGQHFGNNAPNFDNGQPVLGGAISDLRSDTESPFTIYAAVNGGGIFVSQDGGATFPVNLFNNRGAPGAGTYGFISFSQSTFRQPAQPDGNTIYASVANNANPSRFLNLFQSTDRGATWAVLPNAAATTQGYMVAGNTINCQCGYDQTIGVDPQDKTRVYLGFQELFLSTDGGVTFGATPVSRNQIHWDHHALVFSPRTHFAGAPTRVWAGTDGGIHSSSDGGTTWQNLNETIATNLFKNIDMGRYSNFNRRYTYGGTQDTGTIERTGEFAGNDWHLAVDGDGSGVAVSPEDAEDAFGASNGNFRVTTDGGESWFGRNTEESLPPSMWRTIVDQVDGSNVYSVTSTNSGFRPANQLYRSTSDGDSDYSLLHTFGPNVNAIANSKGDPNVIWVGFTDGRVQRTRDALSSNPNWGAPITIPGGLNQPVGGVAINPLDTLEVVVTYEGFCGALCVGPAITTRHVFLTRDNGATWNDISGTNGQPASLLPDLPTHSAVIDPNAAGPFTIIVSNDAGVWSSADLGANWAVLGAGLPFVDCTSLAIDYSVTPSVLRVGTYGRSVFELR